MEIVEIKSEKLNDKYYKIKHTSGLTIYVSPKEGYKSAYAIFGTHFGSVNSHFITNGEEKSKLSRIHGNVKYEKIIEKFKKAGYIK